MLVTVFTVLNAMLGLLIVVVYIDRYGEFITEVNSLHTQASIARNHVRIHCMSLPIRQRQFINICILQVLNLMRLYPRFPIPGVSAVQLFG